MTSITPIFLFALASGITPGPNNTLLLHSGAHHGYRKSLPHLLGITLGMIPLFYLVGTFLSQIQLRFPHVQSILFAISGAYILFLSIKIASAPQPGEGSNRNQSPWSISHAAAFQWLNPKVWMMAVSVFGSGMGGGSGLLRTTVVTAIFALVCFPTMSIWTLFGTKLKSILRNPVGFRVFHISLAIILSASFLF